MDATKTIIIPDIRVMYLRTTEIPVAIPPLWNELEAKFPSMKQRKCYGAVVDGKEYWAGVEMMEGDDPAKLGLTEGTLTGGKYASTTVEDWPRQNLSVVIPAACEQLSKDRTLNPNGPVIEYYTSDMSMVVMAKEKLDPADSNSKK